MEKGGLSPLSAASDQTAAAEVRRGCQSLRSPCDDSHSLSLRTELTPPNGLGRHPPKPDWRPGVQRIEVVLKSGAWAVGHRPEGTSANGFCEGAALFYC